MIYILTQIFAFQNDRGKNLTELEKLKAFLMYQVYLNYSPEDDPTDSIKYIESEFTDIYKQTERIKKLEEDQVLNHYSTAFLKYSGGPLENVKKELSESADKEQWIKDFCKRSVGESPTERLRQAADHTRWVAPVIV